MSKSGLREDILALVRTYGERATTQAPFQAGQSSVPVSGKVIGAAELAMGVDAVLDGWLTEGRFTDEFQKRLAKAMESRHALFVNSGSSANLLAIAALTSPKLGELRLKPGDEVITAATGFPTTLNPILQHGLVPVFIDVELGSYNATVDAVAEAIGPRTKAIFLAHTLGNPFDARAISELAKDRGLYLIEDCCDALGARCSGRSVGTYGSLSTTSFYPAHHITTGEGGAVFAQSPKLKKIVESFRDWGRDCWCSPGEDNTCGKRFSWSLGTLPCGYDHKYTYSHIGYNLKSTDLQAAIGLAQLERLPEFKKARKANFATLHAGLHDMADALILPESSMDAEPCWFGFPITLRPSVPFDRPEIIQRLESARIGTRLLFGGNLLRQPAYENTPRRVVGSLSNADTVAERTFWVGLYPGLTIEAVSYTVDTIRESVKELWRATPRKLRLAAG